jgi:GAF domain-containing protein
MERYLAAIHEVTRLLAGARTLAETVPNVLQALGEGIGWDVAAIWLLDKPNRVLRCAGIWSAPGLEATAFREMSLASGMARGVGLPGRVWESGEAAWIVDAVHDANCPRAAAAARSGLSGAFAFPILIETAVVGVVECYSRRTQPPDRQLLDLLGDLGSQIGQFLKRKEVELEREQVIGELKEALRNIKTLKGLLPICASCKKVRDDRGYWDQIETYVSRHSEAEFSHGICPDCVRRLYPDLYPKLRESRPDLFNREDPEAPVGR